MSFTDNDLKCLKDRLAEQKSVGALVCYGNPPLTFDCKALLARLEAAEEVISQDRLCLHEAYDVWRRSCGKDGHK